MGSATKRVKPIVDMAISRFEAFDRLPRELVAAKNELASGRYRRSPERRRRKSDHH